MTDELREWMTHKGFERIEDRGENSNTPLLLASREGNAKFVEELLALGADPLALNNDQNNAVWNALFANDARCVLLLLKAGAGIDNQNVNGATPLHYASSSGKTEMVKLLCDGGANRELVTLDGFTPLELASTVEIMKILKTK